MTHDDWLKAFQEISRLISEATDGMAGTAAARQEYGIGAGGDRTVEIDRLAEETAIRHLERLHHWGAGFSLLSEEIGLRDFGSPYPLVLLDPIDGSLNAKQGLPLFATMLSLLDGPLVADVSVGHVRNLISGETWDAIRGGGAFHNGRPLTPLRPADPNRIEVVGMESAPANLIEARALLEQALKVRILGSMALSIAHTAAGGIDVHCSTIRARVFDMTASVLMVEEVGGVATDMAGASLGGLTAGLDTRTTLLCSAHPHLHKLACGLLNP